MKHHNTTHGLSKTRAYKSWQNARARCSNPNNKDYHHYGERGIAMSEAWAKNFGVFYAEMGECPVGYSLERIDVEKGYVSGNCKWIPKREQNNNKRTNHLITYRGETKPMSVWAKQFGIPQRTVWDRMQYGWSLDRVFSNEKHSIRRKITCDGKTMCVMDWSRLVGIGESTIRRRINLGWPIEKALTVPVGRAA
jgi:hypothetical protein